MNFTKFGDGPTKATRLSMADKRVRGDFRLEVTNCSRSGGFVTFRAGGSLPVKTGVFGNPAKRDQVSAEYRRFPRKEIQMVIFKRRFA